MDHPPGRDVRAAAGRDRGLRGGHPVRDAGPQVPGEDAAGGVRGARAADGHHVHQERRLLRWLLPPCYHHQGETVNESTLFIVI